MNRYYYSDTIKNFLNQQSQHIIGILTQSNQFNLETTQRDAWNTQISILKESLAGFQGTIIFEYDIPRMGSRIDTILIIDSVVFVLEFKVGQKNYLRTDIDQVWDYVLDLKNFHEPSHDKVLVPILIATEATQVFTTIEMIDDNSLLPIKTNSSGLIEVLKSVSNFFSTSPNIEAKQWLEGSYCPTPTIIEAATALYNNHSVENISRNDAGAQNITKTSASIEAIIKMAEKEQKKCICFVTGVPGSGKTLVGLNVATNHSKEESTLYSVYLSGNGPLVMVLREALVRDKVAQAKAQNFKLTKKTAHLEVKKFIQNVHNFRDDCLSDHDKPPFEHVAIFDEAQRAWNKEQTAKFMKQKRNTPNFSQSEPEFLISCLDRHRDWAVIVCLVGGGQEINTGEAGISEWLNGLLNCFPDWEIYLSNRITDDEYQVSDIQKKLQAQNRPYHEIPQLHLAVSLRSYRAEKLSLFIKLLLDLDGSAANKILQELQNYPIVLTRDLSKAKQWLKSQARGTERYGMVVSSQAERLKPLAIDIRPNINPVTWFLNDKDHVHSSYYLEDVATEFHIQGLELDWTCIIWDADLRIEDGSWSFNSFRGNKWQKIRKATRQSYLLNAYRVLLTRARQGLIIVVPQGNPEDHTRLPEFYNPIYNYLLEVGIQEIRQQQ